MKMSSNKRSLLCSRQALLQDAPFLRQGLILDFNLPFSHGVLLVQILVLTPYSVLGKVYPISQHQRKARHLPSKWRPWHIGFLSLQEKLEDTGKKGHTRESKPGSMYKA
jgi:hypothetical protein